MSSWRAMQIGLLFAAVTVALGCQHTQSPPEHSTRPMVTADTGRTAPGETPPTETSVGVAMVSVPSGVFMMGDPFDEGSPDELPVHPVALSEYEIGKYEVSNGDYAGILNWALETARLAHDSGDVSAFGQVLLGANRSRCQIRFISGRFQVLPRQDYPMEEHPVLEVSWYGAVAYCNWLSERDGLEPCYDTENWACDFSRSGYHPPTEAQWERAAAWSTEGSGRHWRYSVSSDEIHCAAANLYESESCNPLGLFYSPYTAPRGYYNGASGTVDARSPAGCYDMSGNVREWCNDWYGSTYYRESPGDDPPGPAMIRSRVIRGGSYSGYADHSRTSCRQYAPPDTLSLELGFR